MALSSVNASARDAALAVVSEADTPLLERMRQKIKRMRQQNLDRRCLLEKHVVYVIEEHEGNSYEVRHLLESGLSEGNWEFVDFSGGALG